MKKILAVFGTRPEAIKICPLVKELQKREGFEVRVCVTAQHRAMLDSVLSAFGITPDADLDLMRQGQTLSELTSRILCGLSKVLKNRPDAVLVHGDTTTAFAASLACFYEKIPVCHVEAGLRTHDLSAPFPEEFNRRAVALTARLHFAPTEGARRNLLDEGISRERVFVTGNTVIDALSTTVRENFTHPVLDWANGDRLILLTAHRRENIGEPMRNIFKALRRVIEERRGLRAVYPMHKNPAVRSIAESELADCGKILLTEPIDVFDCHNLMARSFLVLTDSGGIQEEAPSLGVPVLVTRNTTERPEGVEAGVLRLVGTEEERIYSELCRLLDDGNEYAAMARAVNPYGDGKASERIADILEKFL